MGYMNFKSPTLESLFKDWKWARNNTIQLAEVAQKENLWDFKPEYKMKDCDEYTVAHQFSCILTTTSTYLSKILGDKKAKFGILRKNGKEITKSEIKNQDMALFLKEQLEEAEVVMREIDDKRLKDALRYFNTLNSHEYLHQGQLIVMFREANIDFPDRFSRAWAL